MFGENLRQLSQAHASISALCRELGINRTQYNRYLSGESFPRPDVLHRICTFFDVDARILLEPVEALEAPVQNLLTHPQISEFVGAGTTDVPQDLFPDGFYRFSRRSFMDDLRFVVGLVWVYRADDFTFVRGYEAKEAMRQQGLPEDATRREFRGFVMQQEDGLAVLASRRDSLTTSFNFLSRVTSFQNNFWVGYVTRTVRESMEGHRAARLVFEHIGDDMAKALEAARGAGFCGPDDLIAYHRKLLRIDEAFR